MGVRVCENQLDVNQLFIRLTDCLGEIDEITSLCGKIDHFASFIGTNIVLTHLRGA